MALTERPVIDTNGADPDVTNLSPRSCSAYAQALDAVAPVLGNVDFGTVAPAPRTAAVRLHRLN